MGRRFVGAARQTPGSRGGIGAIFPFPERPPVLARFVTFQPLRPGQKTRSSMALRPAEPARNYLVAAGAAAPGDGPLRRARHKRDFFPWHSTDFLEHMDLSAMVGGLMTLVSTNFLWISFLVHGYTRWGMLDSQKGIGYERG